VSIKGGVVIRRRFLFYRVLTISASLDIFGDASIFQTFTQAL
jgi:hypothetical protein